MGFSIAKAANRGSVVSRMLVTAVCLVLALSVAGYALAPIIIEVEGNVQVKKPTDRSWTALQTGQWKAEAIGSESWKSSLIGKTNTEIPADGNWTEVLVLPEGTRIRTKLGSKVIAQVEAGTTMDLGENSIFEVVSATKGSYDFKLWVGNVRSKVKKLQTGRRFSVRTGVAVASIRGTDFTVAADKSGKTELSVYEGKVNFRSLSTGKDVDVSANQSAVVSAVGVVSEVVQAAAVTTSSSASSGDEVSAEALDNVAPQLFITSVTTVANGIRVAGLTEAGATVTANGYKLGVRADGTFDQVLSDVTATSVTFEASDAAGNVTRDARNPSGLVDKEAPSLVSFSYSKATASAGENITVTLVLSDASVLASPVAVTLQGSGGGRINGTLSGAGSVLTGTLAVPTTAVPGVYSLSAIRVADILGNSGNVTPTALLTIVNEAPATPSSLTAFDATSGGAATVSWSAVSAADLQGYTLYQGSNPSGPWTAVSVGSGNSYSASNLINGSTYFYYVVANDFAGNASVPSTVVSVTPSDQTAPAAPSGLSATASGSNISLSWGASTGASSYNIYRSGSASGGAPWTKIGQTSSTSFNVTGLASGTTYHFSVTASDNNAAPPSGQPNESAVGTNSASATTN